MCVYFFSFYLLTSFLAKSFKANETDFKCTCSTLVERSGERATGKEERFSGKLMQIFTTVYVCTHYTYYTVKRLPGRYPTHSKSAGCSCALIVLKLNRSQTKKSKGFRVRDFGFVSRARARLLRIHRVDTINCCLCLFVCTVCGTQFDSDSLVGIRLLRN